MPAPWPPGVSRLRCRSGTQAPPMPLPMAGQPRRPGSRGRGACRGRSASASRQGAEGAPTASGRGGVRVGHFRDSVVIVSCGDGGGDYGEGPARGPRTGRWRRGSWPSVMSVMSVIFDVFSPASLILPTAAKGMGGERGNLDGGSLTSLTSPTALGQVGGRLHALAGRDRLLRVDGLPPAFHAPRPSFAPSLRTGS